MNIDIRLASEKEIEIVHNLMLEAFEEYRSLDVPSSALNEPMEQLINSIKSGSEQALLSFVEGRPLGSLRFTFKEEGLYFSRLSVAPNARGKGIAKSMLESLERYAIEKGIKKIECRVRASIPKNISLYEAMGYVISKEEVVTNPNGLLVNTVVMEKIL